MLKGSNTHGGRNTGKTHSNITGRKTDNHTLSRDNVLGCVLGTDKLGTGVGLAVAGLMISEMRCVDGQQGRGLCEETDGIWLEAIGGQE